MSDSDTRSTEDIPEALLLAFAPLHKRAFGMAIGLAGGGLLLVLTVYGLLRGDPPLLPLLGSYLTGYSVSPGGAAVGFAWAVFVGFVAGWFVAFCRNFVIAASIWLVRTRAELRATRDFLDHI